jgi:Na+-transporting methylmalonyl-CoA/oxaloacetate decarboxylase gamma subunit
VEKCDPKVLARFVLTSGTLWRTIMGMMYLYSLCLLILALWLASEIVARDLSAPAPKDPYRLDRWRKGEGDPDQ